MCLAVARLHAAPPAPDADNGGLTLPPGFSALVVADDLGGLRFLTVAPNGDIYVKTRDAGIIALRDQDGDGRAEVRQSFGSGGGTGIALRDGWLYHSTTSAVLRYRLTAGQLVPGGEPQTVVSNLPDARQHNSKSFAFGGDGKLYVEVGSPSNAFGDPDRQRGAKGKDPTDFLKAHGGVWRFDPDRLGQTQADGFRFSTGHRHLLSLAWNAVSRAFFVVMMGRDQLNTVAPQYYSDDDNAELPAEEMHVLREGANLGWPFTYYDPIRKARMVAPEYGGDNGKRAEPGRFPDPLVAFPAHWAPLQMAFYQGTQFPERYRGGAFVAFHGSWNRAPRPQRGYNVTFVPFDAKGMPRGGYEVFADGFAGARDFTSVREARHRPAGLALGPDGSLYVADSVKGRVWRIVHGAKAPAAGANAGGGDAAGTATARADTGAAARGAAIYQQNCAVCHMADGSGVPDMQPPLDTSTVAAGDATTLLRLLLRGADSALPAGRQRYSNPMPTFELLDDTELAAVASYVRSTFGRAPGPITPADVATVRRGQVLN